MRLILLGIVLVVPMLAQTAVDRALALARQRRYAEARQTLEGVPEPVEARARVTFHRLRAAVASGLGDQAAAADEMKLALAAAPADAGLLLATAAAELAAGRLDDALGHARGAGNRAEAHAMIGDIQEKRGEFVEAAKAYQAAVALAPEREELRIALALELVQHQTFRPAITVLEQAAPLFPKSARIRTLLGIAHYALGNIEPAIASLTEAVQIDPQLEPAYSYLAKIVLESSAPAPGAATEALCLWDKTVCAALQLRQARQQDDAALQAAAIRSLERAPENSAVGRCELGRAYEWTERWTAARTQMEACVRLDPAPQNHYRLALIYQHLGLEALARQEMARRDQLLKELSEEGARRLNATQAFQYSLK